LAGAYGGRACFGRRIIEVSTKEGGRGMSSFGMGFFEKKGPPYDNWAQVIREVPEALEIWGEFTKEERSRIHPLLEIMFREAREEIKRLKEAEE